MIHKLILKLNLIILFTYFREIVSNVKLTGPTELVNKFDTGKILLNKMLFLINMENSVRFLILILFSEGSFTSSVRIKILGVI